MQRSEKERLVSNIRRHLLEKGMPINIRDGSNETVADWVTGVVTKFIVEDEPQGVVMGCDYDLCPRCGGVIGSSANFCKRCGCYIREVPGSVKKRID